MPSSDPTSRIDIEEWRSSLSLPTSHAVPTLGRYPLQPSTSSSQHSSLSNYPKKRTPPFLHLQQPLSNLSATASSGGDDTDASGSETESQKAIKSSKKEEADRLVDSTLELLLSVWPSPSPNCPLIGEPNVTGDDTVPLRTFVNEILRRSRSSCATLRAARWYLERASVLLPPATERKSTLVCARRTFLSSLILANKFMHDRVYSNRAWSRVSGLAVSEVSKGEAALGDVLGWSLWVGREQNDVCPQREANIAAKAPALIPLATTPNTTSLSPVSVSSSPLSSVLESPRPTEPFGLESLLAKAQSQTEAKSTSDDGEVPYRRLLLAPLAGPLAAPSNFYSVAKLLASSGSAPSQAPHLSLLGHRPSVRPLSTSDSSSSFASATSYAASSRSPSTTSSDDESCGGDDESLSTASSSIETASDSEHLSAIDEGETGVVGLVLGRQASRAVAESKRRFSDVSGVLTPRAQPMSKKLRVGDGAGGEDGASFARSWLARERFEGEDAMMGTRVNTVVG